MKVRQVILIIIGIMVLAVFITAVQHHPILSNNPIHNQVKIGVIVSDVIPDSLTQTADPAKAKPGDIFCVWSPHPTIERHVWIAPSDFQAAASCGGPNSLLFSATKTVAGWTLYLYGRKVWRDDDITDALARKAKWIRMTEIVP